MRKLTFLLLFISVACLSNCKKDSKDPGPDPDTNQPYTPIQFLRSFEVPGSEKITFDSVTKNYQISLPESYFSNSAELKMSLNKNVVLIDSLGKATTDSTITYNFKGNQPLSFTLRDKEDKFAGSFTVYFEIAGAPKVELLTKAITINTNGFKSPFKFVSGVGTIPSRPGQTPPVIKASNAKTGFTTQTTYYQNQENITFEDIEKLVGADPIKLEVLFADKDPVVFEGITFTRGEPFSWIPDAKFVYSTKDSVFVSGGYFVSTSKYTVKFTSDFVTTPATASLKFISPTSLNLEKFPSNVAEGSYLLTFHEGGKLIGKGAIYVANTAPKSLESVWKGELMQALTRNTEPLTFKKGETFYAKPSPVEYGSSNTNFDVKKLPSLRLKSGATTVDLKPTLAVVNWATAGVSYPVGKYVVPANLAAGQYEVMAVFPDKTVSKPYWAKMRVN
ncbi:hypothetical protein MUK70_22865 [Dyadobacter chenwenxiniae]|uniref:Uncharacterized protein n=1 Tax=Dyadobacter chenwenxiniae TaxID=2906456 RepID=A0A9X1PLE6_9BACT|nr:hypothetical protein [Dyadobacter chenwenxiniae]MCF0062084.1 hypothetical protein [Dyadobacter chenwenxiniae]UON81890.1 hypothetical protein MUK70_22865 [Dyadobacter chenwenxiniae]